MSEKKAKEFRRLVRENRRLRYLMAGSAARDKAAAHEREACAITVENLIADVNAKPPTKDQNERWARDIHIQTLTLARDAIRLRDHLAPTEKKLLVST